MLNVFCEGSSNAGLPCTGVESLVGVVLTAFDSPCKRGITPIAVNMIPVLLCPNHPASATRTMRLQSQRRIWLFCLSQYPSGSASRQLFDANQSTPDKSHYRTSARPGLLTGNQESAEPLHRL